MKKLLFLLLLFCSLLGSSRANSGYYSWKEKTPLPAIPRHRASGWAIGNKGYIGVGHINSGALSIAYQDWWEFDPATNVWTQKANYPPVGGRFACNGFVIGNKGYLGCGNEQNWGSHAEFYEFDPIANVWTQKATFPYPQEGPLAWSVNGKGYMGAGGGQGFYEYNPVNDSWTLVPILGSLPMSWYGMATTINNKAYLLPGGSSQLYEFDPTVPSLIPKAMFPISGLYAAACFALNGKMNVVMGGVGFYTDQKGHWTYDPVTNIWDTLPNFPGSRRHYVQGFSIGTKGYVGTGSNGTNLNDFWEYAWTDTSNATSQTNVMAPQIHIYPIPAQSQVTVELPQSINASKLELYNFSGKMVLAATLRNESQFTINREGWPAGIYILSIKNEKGEVKSTEKIIFD